MIRLDRHGLFQFGKYLAVGGATAGLYFTLLVLTLDFWELNHVYAVSVSYLLAIIFHFMTNKIFTFKSREGNVSREVFRYLCVAFFNYLVTLVVVHIVVDLGKQSTYLGAALAIAVTVGLGYGMTKVWVFHQNRG